MHDQLSVNDFLEKKKQQDNMRKAGFEVTRSINTLEDIEAWEKLAPEEQKKGLSDVVILLIETFYNLLLNVALQASSVCV